MREIKFRAWDNVDYMSSAFTLNDLQKKKIVYTDDVSLMQYTDIKDKTGKEIYEGDVLNHKTGNRLDGKWEVLWDDGCWRLYREYDVQPDGTVRRQLHFLTRTQAKTFEVIGNIYANPELISEG